MLQKGFLKPEISIDQIGKKRFWTGVVFGVLSSFLICLLSSYTRETFRLLTWDQEPYIIPEQEFRLYDLFYSFFATCLGSGFMLIIWLSGRRIHAIKKNYLRIYAIANIWFVIFIVLAAIYRFGSILAMVLYYNFGGIDYLDFLHRYGLLLVLIPFFVVTYQWNIIRLIFKTKYWIFLSYFFAIIISFYLYKTANPNREILNNYYKEQNSERIEFLNNEFIQAKHFGISFSDSTRNILLRRFSDKSFKIVRKVQSAFNTNNKVPIDTLILEKVLIHNLHYQGKYYWNEDSADSNWCFAQPEQIYNQIIKYNDIDEPEVKLLFEILYEQIQLFDISDLGVKNWQEYTHYDLTRMEYNSFIMEWTRTVYSRLTQVTEKLKSLEKYKRYNYLIPDINFVDHGRRQEDIYLDI